jgi:hypothetical protein
MVGQIAYGICCRFNTKIPIFLWDRAGLSVAEREILSVAVQERRLPLYVEQSCDKQQKEYLLYTSY